MIQLEDDKICRFVMSSVRGEKVPCPDFFADESTWKKVFHYARTIHSLLPVLVQIDRSTWKKEISEWIQAEVDAGLAKERMFLTLLDREMEAALYALGGEKIPTILLKGMDLGRRVYPDRMLRPMTDVDLLIPSEKFTDAILALGKVGFRVMGPFPKGRIRVELGRQKGGPVVELHRALQANDTENYLHEVWTHAVETVIQDMNWGCKVLSAEDNLVYLIRHATLQHVVESPIWLNDIHHLIENKDFKKNGDWEKVLWGLAEFKALHGGWFVLNFLKNQWGTTVSQQCLDQLSLKTSATRRKFLKNISESKKLFPVEGRTVSWTIRSRFLLRDSWIEALKYGIQRNTMAAGLFQ